jgi:hypothetical protein
MKPTLQDGWMLTALDSSADSKMAEALTAIGSMMGATRSRRDFQSGGGFCSPPTVLVAKLRS